MHVYIITGASKGIGLALCKQLISEENLLICIARTRNNQLIQLANQENGRVHFHTFDLSQTEEIGMLMEAIIAQLPAHMEAITLINNAGIVDPIGRVENNDPLAITRSIAVNLTAPMILSSLFIENLQQHQIPKKIINISSGAGRNPYTGWSSYCTSKAGLDHFSRVVALEQREEAFAVKMISIAPGIIDTGMQMKIRQSAKQDFALVDKFIDYQQQGQLSSPADTAQKLIRMMKSEEFAELDTILDLRDFS